MHFNAFDPAADVQKHERYLPHWFQPDTATFLTFRTADSLPKEVINRWIRELEAWPHVRRLWPDAARLAVRGRWKVCGKLFADLDPQILKEFRKHSEKIFNRSLDECHGACVLRDHQAAEIVANAILYYDHHKYEIDRFVIMPNHVHVLVQFFPESSLEVVSQSWMRYTARQINVKLGRRGRLWQSEPFDHLIRSAAQFEYLQHYIESNPAKAFLKQNEYLYWQRPV